MNSLSKSVYYVLYVEDERSEIYLIQEALKKCTLPLQIDFARSMEEALALFDVSKHTLVVTDYNLPDAEAPQIAKTLLSKYPNTTIIAISSAYTSDRIAEAKASGISECLEKSNIKDGLQQISVCIDKYC